MKFFNKVFSGGQIEKELVPNLSNHMIEAPQEVPHPPLPTQAANESENDQKNPQSILKTSSNEDLLNQGFGNLETYDFIQSKLNINELDSIYLALENISNTVTNLNQNNKNTDESLENWQSLIDNIASFVTKKKQLQSIELQMKQTIDEMHELHTKMIDSIGAVRDYNLERSKIYLQRKNIADELGKKLL
jgi:hypothetical protein